MVEVDTTRTGNKSGDNSFIDNESNENPFNFAITGTVNLTLAPEIAVTCYATSLDAGYWRDWSTDVCYSDRATLNGAAVQHIFTVRNDGDAPLTTSGLVVPSGFSVVEGL